MHMSNKKFEHGDDKKISEFHVFEEIKPCLRLVLALSGYMAIGKL